VERGFYGRQLARVFELFPREQILILRSDNLKRDATATITDVCRFLGVEAPYRPIASRISRPAAEIDYPATLTPEDVTFLQRQFTEEMVRFERLV
jgi:hypothetical protein